MDAVGEHRLPLADHLFEERELFAAILEQFPRAHAVVPRLRHLQRGETVELVMEQLQAESGRDPRRLRQLAAIRYYLQSAIGECESRWERAAARGITNYKALLDLIEHARDRDERVCLVTFNYDSMLEAAMPTTGVTISSIQDYVSSPAYKVIKLHGSVNWGRAVKTPVKNLANGQWALVNELIDRAGELEVAGTYQFLAQRPMHLLDNQPLVPAIAIPLARKATFECPAEHITALVECLPEVHKLLVIGWRATDEPFLELLRTKGRQGLRGLVVAGSPTGAREVIDNLKRGLDRPGDFREAPGGFSDFILRHEAEAFLASD